MRIALISHTALYWTELYARYLVTRGHEVRVVSFGREPLEGLDVVHVGRGTPARRKALSYLGRVPRTRRLLRRFKPDVVLASYLSSNGLVAALCRPRALVVSGHGTDVYGETEASHGRGLLLRFVCSRADAIHVVSSGLAEALAAHGVPRARIECFPIGVDVSAFAPASEGSSLRAVDIVCTRRHEPVYDTAAVLAALALVRRRRPDLHAVLLGGGPLLEERRAQARASGLDDAVVLPGTVDSSKVRETLQRAKVYVSASHRDGASSSLLEAMAAGSFPVVSDIGANRDWIVDGTTGLLFRPGDPVHLARALLRALEDGRLRESARAANLARVERDGSLVTNMRRMEMLLERAAT
jgi:glycosyltransferase involved in cell wall biosynthesis